jgi:hypothetical protein
MYGIVYGISLRIRSKWNDVCKTVPKTAALYLGRPIWPVQWTIAW